MQDMQVPFLGWEDSLDMAAHFNFLTWEIPWTEEPDGLQSMGSQQNETWQLTNNNISMKRNKPQSFLWHMRTQKAAICQPGREVSPEMKLADILKLNERLTRITWIRSLTVLNHWGNFAEIKVKEVINYKGGHASWWGMTQISQKKHLTQDDQILLRKLHSMRDT